MVNSPKLGERYGAEMAPHYYKYYTTELNKYSDKELIIAFNKSIGIRAFNIARQGYLWAMRTQLERRKIDFSVVGNEKVMSYKNKVKLINKKLELFQ